MLNSNGYFIINDVIVNDVGEQRALHSYIWTSWPQFVFKRGATLHTFFFTFQKWRNRKNITIVNYRIF